MSAQTPRQTAPSAQHSNNGQARQHVTVKVLLIIIIIIIVIIVIVPAHDELGACKVLSSKAICSEHPYQV